MGQKKSKGNPGYKPQYTGQLEEAMGGFLLPYANQALKRPEPRFANYGGIAAGLQSGQMLGGGKLPSYNPGSNFGFNTPNLSYAPKQAYQGAIDMGQENILRQQQMAQSQAGLDMAARGLGASGLLAGQNTTLAREAQKQAADFTRQMTLDRAKDQLAVDQSRAGMDLQRQGLQADENFRRGQQSLQARQAFNDMNLGNIQALLGLQGQATEDWLRPFQLLSGMYSQNLGAPITAKPKEGKGGPLGTIMDVVGTGAGIASKVAPMFCLPSGTLIELDGDGFMEGRFAPVETIKVGDKVRGGEVIAVQSFKRTPEHYFSSHVFEAGEDGQPREVVMTFGHPAKESILEVIPIKDHPSETTHDILTTSGSYWVNGVELGSTIVLR